MAIKKEKISVIIIHYNTPEYLKGCIDAIFSQSYENIEIIFIDNNSPDKTGMNFVKEKYDHLKNFKLIYNIKNLGYAKAANQGIKMATDAKYIVITNPDILYTKDYFKKCVERIKADPKTASITGKVYKYDFDRDKKTDIIDTVGLFAYKNRRFIDDGQGLVDEGQFDKEKEIFGVSGACPLYTKEALEDVKINNEYFDEDFFMYKEDVDLAWRLKIYGWKSLYYPKAIAYHGRGTGVHRRFFNKELLKVRDRLSKFQKHHSFRNQHLMQAKNEFFINFIRDFFPIMGRKFLMLIYITFKEPYLWKSYKEYWKLLAKILKKRRIIMRHKKISTKVMRKWFKKQSSYLK